MGYDSDQSANYPEVWQTAPIYNWGQYYTAQIQSLFDGTWKKDDYYGSLKDGFNLLAPFGKLVSDATKSEIEAKKAKIIDGSLNVFAGPLKDNKGAEKVAAGATLSADDSQTMMWLVDGVVQ